jgi:CheY-like chemotaxis protein
MRAGTGVRARPARIMAVSDEAARADLLAALLADTTEYDVIFVESVENAYSRVKQLVPDLVILFLDVNDEAPCQVLSMLQLDQETSAIPVVTWLANREPGAFEELIAAVTHDPRHPLAAFVAN